MSEKFLNKLCTKFIPFCLFLGQAAPTMFLLIIFSLWTLLCLFTMEGNLDFFSNYLLCILAFDRWSYTELSKILTWKCNSIKLWGHRSSLTTIWFLLSSLKSTFTDDISETKGMNPINVWFSIQLARAFVMTPVVLKQKAILEKSRVPEWLTSHLSSKGSCFPWSSLVVDIGLLQAFTYALGTFFL